jgi:hypothetical protein
MLTELLVRFVLGGFIVSLVAAVAEVCEPKTFAGLFGAAPSVALATLTLAYFKKDAAYVATEGRSMVIGALGLFAYSCACVAGAKERRVPVGGIAIAAWIIWFAVVATLWGVTRASGLGS